MDTASFMVLFDVIILGYGLYVIYSAMKMKKTGEPSNILINEEELVGARDIKSFCAAMATPFSVLGLAAVLYGIVGLVNDLLINIPMLNFFSIVIFLILCFWFFRLLKKNKAEFLK